MKYTMVNGTRDGRFELICYLNGEIVAETVYATEQEARNAANSWLDIKVYSYEQQTAT